MMHHLHSFLCLSHDNYEVWLNTYGLLGVQAEDGGWYNVPQPIIYLCFDDMKHIWAAI